VTAGNDSIVKATIDAGVTYPAGRAVDENARHVAGRDAPVMAIGDNAIVKAHVDARSQVFNDQSTTVHGQYVGQQTFVHVGSIVQKMTVSFSSDAVGEIEKSLPDDLASLMAIVANTCRWLIRNDMVRAKQHVAGGVLKVVSNEHDKHRKHRANLFAKLLRKKSSYDLAEEAISQRHELCDRAIGRIHEIANSTGDQSVLADVEELDDCVIEVKQSHRDIVWLDRVKGNWDGKFGLWTPWIYGGIPLLSFLEHGVNKMNRADAFGIAVGFGGFIATALACTLLTMRKSWRISGTQEALVEDLPGLETKLSRLVSRYEFRVPVINLLCAVACVDGAIQAMEATALRAAMVELDYSPTDRILRDIMASWRTYLAQGTAVSMLDSVLLGIEPLAGTEEGRRVWNAALSIAESNGGIDAREGAFLRRLKEALEIHVEEKKRSGWRGLLGG
jgi:tellurite resistance protein